MRWGNAPNRMAAGFALLAPVLAALALVNDRGPGMTWEERLGLELDRVMFVQQRLASACDAWLRAQGASESPAQLELHREIARRNRSPVEDVRRAGLRYYRREFRAYWVRGIALGRAALVRDLRGTDQADGPRCTGHRALLEARRAQGWAALRAAALARLP